MDEFFTWTTLGTYAGAVMFTTLITQLFKGVGFIERIPTRIFSYLVAAVILVLAVLFTATEYSAAEFVLCFINAAVVSLAANGTYDAVNEATK